MGRRKIVRFAVVTIAVVSLLSFAICVELSFARSSRGMGENYSIPILEDTVALQLPFMTPQESYSKAKHKVKTVNEGLESQVGPLLVENKLQNNLGESGVEMALPPGIQNRGGDIPGQGNHHGWTRGNHYGWDNTDNIEQEEDSVDVPGLEPLDSVDPVEGVESPHPVEPVEELEFPHPEEPAVELNEISAALGGVEEIAEPEAEIEEVVADAAEETTEILLPPGIEKKGEIPGKGKHLGWERGNHHGWNKDKGKHKGKHKGREDVVEDPMSEDVNIAKTKEANLGDGETGLLIVTIGFNNDKIFAEEKLGETTQGWEYNLVTGEFTYLSNVFGDQVADPEDTEYYINGLESLLTFMAGATTNNSLDASEIEEVEELKKNLFDKLSDLTSEDHAIEIEEAGFAIGIANPW